jgi:hypothetical protein
MLQGEYIINTNYKTEEHETVLRTISIGGCSESSNQQDAGTNVVLNYSDLSNGMR